MAGLALVAPQARAATAAPRMKAVGGLLHAAGSPLAPGQSTRAVVACVAGPLVLARAMDAVRCCTKRMVIFLNAWRGCETCC